jgi:flagellar hook protein FlgE
MVSKDNTSSTWRWYADCEDDTDLDLHVGTGTLTFDIQGQLQSESGSSISIDLDQNGVRTALIIDPDFELVTQFANVTGSELNVRSQDGAPMGVLTSFSVTEDGTISGLFSNGLTTELGVLNVTKFANNNGLLRDASNMFSTGRNSGLAQDGEAQNSGRGSLRAGALESSNVDIAQEFTDMIQTQRGFQANARTISASDELLIELINLTR